MKKKLKSIFLAVAGRSLQKSPEHSQWLNRKEEFDAMMQQLDEYFAPKLHDTYGRFTFWSMRPNTGETLEKFLLSAQVVVVLRF